MIPRRKCLLIVNDAFQLSENRRLLILNDSDSSSDWAKGAVEFAKEFGIGIEIREISMCYAYEKFIETVDENDRKFRE